MKTSIVSTRPKTGRLLWIENKTFKNIVVATGPFSTLQFTKSKLREDPAWKNGKFKITY
ncbi:MAG: hypothetical protein FD170_3347 [Bacteroidetes bacterium]|jgi:hypothetical protein|nr:MAG: hypothetical protein FD170_3347 [Bacteroidota bacterium]